MLKLKTEEECPTNLCNMRTILFLCHHSKDHALFYLYRMDIGNWQQVQTLEFSWITNTFIVMIGIVRNGSDEIWEIWGDMISFSVSCWNTDVPHGNEDGATFRCWHGWLSGVSFLVPPSYRIDETFWVSGKWFDFGPRPFHSAWVLLMSFGHYNRTGYICATS